MMENKIHCPNCNELDCYVETENDIKSYLCVSCGYTTNSLYVNDSNEMEKWEENTPLLIKSLKFIDPDTNLVWYPAVLNFPSMGMVFPDGTNEENWMWRAVPTIDIPEDKQKEYPVPGKPGEFYVKKLDMENSKFYEQNEFKQACTYIGILNETEQ